MRRWGNSSPLQARGQRVTVAPCEGSFGQDMSFLDVFGGMADWQSSKRQAPSSRKIPNSKAQVRRIKNAKFKMSKLPDEKN